MSLGEALLRIGKTGLLAGALGLALYGALAAMAGWPGAHLLLAALLALPMALLTSWQVFEGWRGGEFPLWLTDSVRRSENPAGFWMAMGWTGLCALLLHALWLWAGLAFLGLLG